MRLFHATLARNVPSNLAHGLRPSRGRLCERYHGGARREGHRQHRPLLFTSDSPVAGSLLGALCFRIARETGRWGRPFRRVLDLANLPLLDADIARSGALIVLDRAPFRHCRSFMEEREHPAGVEAGDWWADVAVMPVRVLAGDGLVRFLYRSGVDDARLLPPQWQPSFARGVCGGWTARRMLDDRLSGAPPSARLGRSDAWRRFLADDERAASAADPFSVRHLLVEGGIPAPVREAPIGPDQATPQVPALRR